ncbi:MAG: hypothetical protein UT31_C0007G0016 [Parcubacteria group bacterium GW2011_GWF2_39_13b]|nr:MAG: hypothetical protein UT31_C0007G0016 [Parcubacteria group bacterium GW2011_GWF2_39_13b]
MDFCRECLRAMEGELLKKGAEKEEKNYQYNKKLRIMNCGKQFVIALAQRRFRGFMIFILLFCASDKIPANQRKGF